VFLPKLIIANISIFKYEYVFTFAAALRNIIENCVIMISYYCYCGDPVIGQNFVKIMFGDLKVMPFFEENLHPNSYGGIIHNVLIRYFIDGEVSQYPDVKENKVYYSRKLQCLSIDYHLVENETCQMDLTDTYFYIKETTIRSMQMFEQYCKKKKIAFNTIKLEEDIIRLSDYLYRVVIEKVN